MAIILHYAVPLSILHNGQLRLIEKKLYSRTRGRIDKYRTRFDDDAVSRIESVSGFP